MARRNRRSANPPPRASGAGLGRIEAGPGQGDEDYIVRPIAGARAIKEYRCPGCDQEIRAGVAHVVVWPQHDVDADDRRHWHTGCWNSRRTRGITRKWS